MRNTERSTRRPGKGPRALSLLFALLLLAGCSAPEAPEATPTPAPLLAATPAPVPAEGGTLLLPIPINPFTRDDDVTAALDALAVTTKEMRNFYTLLYEPLLRCDASNRLTPSLAERWSADETGRVWTLTLRAGVYWHTEDTTLNAGDVIYTLEQIKNLGEKSCYFAALDAAVASWERVDDLTVQITMKQRGMAGLYALTFPVLPAQGGTMAGLPVNGTGPYKLVRYVDSPSDSYVDLEVHASWWKQRPYLSGVRCFARENNSVALDSYEAGLLNMVLTDSISAGKYREEDVTNVLDVMTQDGEMLLINHRNSILSDPRVRRAIAYALNRSAIISNVYMNRAAVSDVPVPPDSFLYAAASKIYDYDAAAAETLLAEAGWIDGNEDGVRERNGQQLAFRLLVNESTENSYRKSAAAMVEAQLEEFGFDITIETARYRLGEADSEFETRLAGGDYDLAMAGFSLPESGDLSAYLTGGGACHFAGSVSARLTECVAAVATAVDETAMREAHEALQLAFVEELPFVMLYFRMNSLVYSAGIHGVADVREPDTLRTVERWYIHLQE